MNIATVFPEKVGSAPAVLQIHDLDRNLVIEARYLVDLQLLQLQLSTPKPRRSDRPTHLVTLQGQVMGLRFQRVDAREYLHLGQSVVELRGVDAEALRAWLKVETRA